MIVNATSASMDPALARHLTPTDPALPAQSEAEVELTPAEVAAQMDRIYERGDRIAGRFILLHALIATGLASAYGTWLVSGVVTACAVAMFFISAWLLPRSFITRCIAGISLQTFVALHIYQLHGLAEMHFFFFTALTVLIVYQDWKCLWPGALGIIAQHTAFALLHNSGVNVFFFEASYVDVIKLTYHFGIVLGHVGICGYWAHLLKAQTIASVRQNLHLQKINTQVRAEIAERRSAEAALRAAEAQFRRIAANIPGMVFQYVLKPDGSHHFPFLSEGCRYVLGIDPQKGYEDPDSILAATHPEDRERLSRSIEASATELSPWTWEGRILLPGGELKWIQGVSRPERREDGSVMWDGVLMDATERKLAEEKLHIEMVERQRVEEALREAQTRYQRMADNMPGVVYQFVQRLDGSFGFPYMSGGCREIFEVEVDQATTEASYIFGRIHPEDRPSLFQSIEESANLLQPWRWKGRLDLGDGRIKWIQGSSRPAKQPDETIVWDGVVVDVTELKLAEAELRATKEEAERANVAKSEFLSRMSHELRTPLNAILGFGQLLEAQPSSDFQAESVHHILKGGRHLLGLINEVLDIARIESGRLELSIEPVQIIQAIHEAVDLVKPLAAQRSISLRIPGEGEGDDCYASADIQRLKQVVLNLLSNAIKYNRDGGLVTVTCELVRHPQESCSRCEGDECQCRKIRVAVQDTGSGIAPAKLSRLFMPFERLGAEQTQIEGSGVGLALSKRLVEAMDGTIGVDSSPGYGSTFFVDLPTAVPPAHKQTAQLTNLRARSVTNDEALPSQNRRTVLQVEDNLANRHLMEQVLKSRGDVELLTAIQGGIALDLARKHQPALILLDMHLPDTTGADILTRLRADPQTREIPVVVVSADATPNQIQRLLAMGARQYLTKPFDIGELMSVIDKMLAE